MPSKTRKISWWRRGKHVIFVPFSKLVFVITSRPSTCVLQQRVTPMVSHSASRGVSCSPFYHCSAAIDPSLHSLFPSLCQVMLIFCSQTGLRPQSQPAPYAVSRPGDCQAEWCSQPQDLPGFPGCLLHTVALAALSATKGFSLLH